ncbi:MAG TPA: S9 family peptidase [Candidatus Krumholzibacteria bacterium]
MKPPVARKIPHAVTMHDHTRIDEYHWLRDRENADVIAHLNAENAYADALLASSVAERDEIYAEMVARIQETDSSVPARRDDFYYYVRTEQGRQYEIFCRRHGDPAGAPEEILLDENEVAKGRAYFHSGVREVSPDHRLLAYTVDTSGAETYDLFVMDIATRRIIDGPISNVASDVEWENDSRSFYYLELDDQMRPWVVRRHILGTDAAGDAEVHREPDASFYVGIEMSLSREFLFVTMESHSATEVRYRRAGDVTAPLRMVHERRPNVEYHLVHSGDSFFILSNEDALNFRVFEAPLDDPGRDAWVEVIAHRPAVKLEQLDGFEHHLVITEREGGQKRIRVLDLRTRDSHHVAFHEHVYTVAVDRNLEYRTGTVRLGYSSLTTPRTIYDYRMDARTLELRKRDAVLGDFDPANYQSERLDATATDGTKIPITLVYRKDVTRDGSAPLLLYGYGAYGVCIEPHFVANRLSLLDRGVIFAMAHVRGGGALGRAWYEKGKLLYKRNSFTDFTACADHLVARHYTSAGRMICYGGSAGGMLIGAVVNMRPDLWRAAVLVVPFVDTLNTMLDATLPLTVIEYDEWGNPADRKFYEYILSYSPYDNIERKAYPPMLVLAGFHDRRVQYWEPAKFVARVRDFKTDDNPVILRTRMTEGHKGASGRYDYLKEVATEYAWMLEQWKGARVQSR